MPHMIGVDLAREIRCMQDQGKVDKQLKLVLISGDNLFSEHIRREMSLFDDMLQKPFTI
jgi:CheY-like chemotaxis protein